MIQNGLLQFIKMILIAGAFVSNLLRNDKTINGVKPGNLVDFIESLNVKGSLGLLDLILETFGKLLLGQIICGKALLVH